MDVLNSIALPQSTEHFHLLLFIINLVMAVAVPYLALLTGVLLVAVWTERRDGQDNAGRNIHRWRYLLDAVLPVRSVYLFLGLLPALAMVFIHAQLFQGTAGLSTGFILLGVVFLVAAGTAAFSFRYTFRIEDALAGAHDGGSAPSAATGLLEHARRTRRRTGTTIFWTILGMAFSFSVAQAISLNPAHWQDIDSILAAVASLDVWLWLLLFLALSAALTGAGMLFFPLKDQVPDGSDDPHGGADRRVGIRLSTGALLVLPAAVVLTLLRLPDAALSGWVYALAALSVLFLFAAFHALYGYVQFNRAGSAAYLFAAVILASTALVTKDQVALHNVTKDHAVALALVYDRTEENLKSSLGVVAKQLTGEDIYNAKCSACHMFDQKKVGPPYLTVIPKYKGNKAGLMAFVLNPVKVDPAYPPMPSQGLKPSEADSIATYLLNKVGAKGS